MSGVLTALGLTVPQPEVVANEANPKGFGEPQWAVGFHTDLLNRANMQTVDGRPAASALAERAATDERNVDRVASWLGRQFEERGPELVVKDPRLVWFVGLWRSAAQRCGADPSYITMLRPVPEVVGSKQWCSSRPFGAASVASGWVNVMLHCERATRGSTRAFVRYDDLLSDWTVPVTALGERLDLRTVRTASPDAVRAVHEFIDPSLRRLQLTWDDIDLPVRLREIAEATWHELDRLVDPAADTPEAHRTLDELRAAYDDYFAECEAVANWAVVAARRAASPTDRLARRLPRGLLDALPSPARRAVRKARGRRD